MKKSTFVVVSFLSVTALFITACKQPEVSGPAHIEISNPLGRDLTVEEVSSVVGLPIPVPGYLPAGYSIASVRLSMPSTPPGPFWNITLVMENGRPSDIITLGVQGFSLGMKTPPGIERAQVGESSAWVTRNTDTTVLRWTDKRGRMLSLEGPVEIEFDELVKIAASVTSPPTTPLEWSAVPDTDLLVLRGESEDITVHLKNISTKDLSISLGRNLDIDTVPSGIDVSINAGTFKLTPGQSRDVTIRVKVGAAAPSPTWPRQPVSSILSTDPPPPVPAGQTEEPAYYLQFTLFCNYEAAGINVRDNHGFSRQLRIDPPPTIPLGMVTLKEAESAANFPLGMLLPEYLPERVNPPPLGYQISATEPHSITAFYSSLRVELSPEPGVTEPPAGTAGERATIRKRQVVIGQGRIDWWAYDIHYAVISDQVPMDELKLVAESMMLIGVYSGSWLGMGK